MAVRPGPSSAKKVFVEQLIRRDSPPKRAVDWLIQIIWRERWCETESEAAETAEKWRTQFLSLLREELNQFHELGRVVDFTFNSSSADILQGSAFVEPRDAEGIKEAKRRQALLDDFEKALTRLKPREFERLCVGLLKEMGAENLKLTPYSADEGIDFYGRLHMRKYMFTDTVFPNIQNQLSVWIVGQAKHYKSSDVSTFEIRDLVGAVELAKGKAFGGAGEKYGDLRMRPCDPVFYLFITTGYMTINSWRLIKQSGVVGMEGAMVASFLADRGVGIEGGAFSDLLFKQWLSCV